MELAMVQSVERALALMEYLNVQGDSGASLVEMSNHLHLKMPTAHNLLKTLVTAGYVEQHAQSRRYTLGMKACILGRRQFQDEKLAGMSLPILQSLETEFGETVMLALYRDGMRRTVACVSSRRSVMVQGRTGQDERFYNSATGRVLLSLLPERTLGRWVSAHGLPGKEWPGIKTETGLREALLRIKTQQWAVYDQPGDAVSAVAAPVSLSDPETYAAIGIYYPATRTPDDGATRMRERLAIAAQTIAQAFGT